MLTDPHIPTLIQTLTNGAWSDRQAAAATLLALGWQPQTDAEHLACLLVQHNWAALIEIGTVAVPALVDAFNVAWEVAVRKAVVSTLGQIDDPTALAALIRAAGDFELEVYWAAVAALRRLGSTAIEALTLALFDPDMMLRDGAVRALAALRDPATVPALIEALQDTSEVNRVFVFGPVDKRICDYAANALEKIATHEALTAVREWEQSPIGQGRRR